MTLSKNQKIGLGIGAGIVAIYLVRQLTRFNGCVNDAKSMLINIKTGDHSSQTYGYCNVQSLYDTENSLTATKITGYSVSVFPFKKSFNL